MVYFALLAKTITDAIAHLSPLALGGFFGNDSLVDVGLDLTEDFFVTLNGDVQGMKESFGSIKVEYDPLLDFDRFVAGTHGLGVHAKIDDQFFGQPGDTAEVRVAADGFGFVDRDGGGSLFLFFGHGVDYPL